MHHFQNASEHQQFDFRYYLTLSNGEGIAEASIGKAVLTMKNKLQEDSSLLELKLNDIKALENQQQQMISDLQNKSLSLEQHITSEFAKLHRLLQDKEQSLIEQLKKEAAGSLGKMEENLKDIKAKHSIIQDHLTYIHLALQLENPVNILRVSYILAVHVPLLF
ncbi:E3 ubiquitin-protein ligase TRIM69-like isoform X2 [Protopterus annectens]|uniref:E3 ubiquitin-protein ligase TRIM69-like isoform X2 n=1 Tax=Protopterus annectens TaxID=7888 RepID=UPI001CFC18EB|nr:E3 ubiquitin-protein ligase TRIM69-like isoform X2 [Protopterus annectens]